MIRILFRIINYIYEIYQSIFWSFGMKPFVIYRQTIPNQSYKHRVIKYYAKKYQCDTLIETGTFKGDTLLAVYRRFERLYSVEIMKSLYDDCKKKFENDKKIRLYCGDSVDLIDKMIDDVKDNARCLFWLDGHYSGNGTGMGKKESPIMEEIRAIFSKIKDTPFVVLIDDARCFLGNNGYPTVDEVIQLVTQYGINGIEVKSDIIRIVKI